MVIISSYRRHQDRRPRWRAPRLRGRLAASVAAVLALVSACSSAAPKPASEATVPATTTPPSSTTAPTTVVPTTTSTTLTPAGAAPCGTASTAPTYRHVIWIWMENHSYGTVIGSGGAPYINSLAKQCGLATNYHNIAHPSLPNYVAAVTGLSLTQIGNFSGDCDPSSSCSTAAASIFGQGETWKAYEESMPGTCGRSSSGNYAARHNPPVYLTSLTGCDSDDVAYPQLAADLAANSLPAFSFVTPNLIDDMHDGTVADGDAWLAKNLPAIFDSVAYRSGTTAVFVTWDEGEGGSSGDCAANTTDVGCHVATLVASPSTVPGTASSALFSHYSLLGTTEDLLGLPKLGQAAGAATMTAAFNL